MPIKTITLSPGRYRVMWSRDENGRDLVGTVITLVGALAAEVLYGSGGERWVNLPTGPTDFWLKLRKLDKPRLSCKCTRLSFPHKRTLDCLKLEQP